MINPESIQELLDEALLSQAEGFVLAVHFAEKRKGDGKPFIGHPLRVKGILESVDASATVRAAGLLHDTIEQTKTTYEHLLEDYGPQVAGMVQDVTEPDKNLSWRERKEQVITHVANMSYGSLLIKSADRIDNLTTLCASLQEEGPDFMKRFNAPLSDQIEMSSKLILALKARWPENPLLPNLEKALDAIISLPKEKTGL